MAPKKTKKCKCGKIIWSNSKTCGHCSKLLWHKNNPGSMTGNKNPMFNSKRFGKLNPNWQGGKHTSKQGYVLVYCPDHPNVSKSFCLPEHRLVMEKHLGRYLTKQEVVHHKNRKVSDNRIENLRLFKNHSEHRKYHRRVELRYIRFLKARILRLSMEIARLQCPDSR